MALYLSNIMLAIALHSSSASFNATGNPCTWRQYIHFGEFVPDGVTSSQSDPLRNWSVLFLGLSQLLLRSEGLVALSSCVSISFILSRSFEQGGFACSSGELWAAYRHLDCLSSISSLCSCVYTNRNLKLRDLGSAFLPQFSTHLQSWQLRSGR